MRKTQASIAAFVLFALAVYNTANGRPADAYVAAFWIVAALVSKGEK